jgi:hypothetical protein
MAERLIKIHYGGRYADRASSCSSFEGAIRAASVRLLMNDYQRADIFDHRFGSAHKIAAMTMTRTPQGIKTTWGTHINAYIKEQS